MSEASLLKAAVEQAINRYLELDPHSTRRLARLSGKTVALELTGLDLTLVYGISPAGVQLLPSQGAAPDATLRGTPLAFATLSLSDNPGKALLEGGVRVDGDTGVGQDFGDLLGKVDIDWEELAAGLLGDPLAHQLGNLIRGLRAWGRRASDSLSADLGEYLQEEARELPPRSELEHLLTDIDRFRSDVDRLEARIRRLERRRGDESGGHDA